MATITYYSDADGGEYVEAGQPGDTVVIEGSWASQFTSRGSTTIVSRTAQMLPNALIGTGTLEYDHPDWLLFEGTGLRVANSYTYTEGFDRYIVRTDNVGLFVQSGGPTIVAIGSGSGHIGLYPPDEQSIEAVSATEFAITDAAGNRLALMSGYALLTLDIYYDGSSGYVSLAPATGGTLLGDRKGTPMWGGTVADVLIGSAFDDTLRGLTGADILFGGRGNDLLQGDGGSDKLYGGAGNDRLAGLDDGDELYGDAGDDQVDGGSGDDYLFGGLGDDKLIGRDGDDYLFGGAGKDEMTGGAGVDRFLFSAPSDSPVGSPDIVRDFARGVDKIDLSRIDARSGGGDDAFILVAAFSGHAGELIQKRQTASIYTVQGDVDGDGVADFAITVIGGGPLGTGDFVL